MTQSESGRRFSDDRLNWCFSSLGCGELSLDEIVALAKRYEIGAVELRVIGGSLDLAAQLDDYRRQSPEKFAALAKSGLVKALDTSFKLVSAQEKDWAELLKIAEVADALGVSYCRVFGGFPYAGAPTPEVLKASAATLKRWHEVRAGQGIKCQLALETHDGYSAASGCRMLFDAAAAAMPIVWDAHHTWRYAGEEFELSMDLLGEQIVHVHVKDSLKPSAGKAGGALPGDGDVPIPALLDLLRESGFTHPVSLEWERWWEPELPPLTEALDAVRRHWLR